MELLKKVRVVARNMRRKLAGGPAGQKLTVLEDDLFLVSYPKSGNTWTRFLVANLMHSECEINFGNIEKFAPDTDVHPDNVLLKAPRPRVFKSHGAYAPRFRRVVLIVRDPRDVAVSYYHHARDRGFIPEDQPIDQFVGTFVAGQYARDYGCWSENVGSWLGAREGTDSFIWLRYEDMLKNPGEALQRIATMAGIDADDALIQRAVANSDVKKMQELERKQGKKWETIAQMREGGKFVRAAKSGQWQDVLSADSVKLIETRFGSVMKQLGYELSQ